MIMITDTVFIQQWTYFSDVTCTWTSQGNVGGTVTITDYTHSFNHNRGKKFFSSESAQTRPGAHPAS
jgi:hypothetical protein